MNWLRWIGYSAGYEDGWRTRGNVDIENQLLEIQRAEKAVAERCAKMVGDTADRKRIEATFGVGEFNREVRPFAGRIKE